MLNKMLVLIDGINTKVAKTLAFLVVPMLLVSLYEIVARYIFNSPTLWGGQIVSLFFVFLVVPGGGYLLRKDGHVRMDLLYSKWNPKRKAITETATFIIFFAFALTLSWKALEMAWSSVMIMERSWGAFKGPIYPKKIALALGAVLLLLQGTAQLIRNIQFIRDAEAPEGKDL